MGRDSAILALLFAAFMSGVQPADQTRVTTTICEGQTKTISCPSGYVNMAIQDAVYGRTDRSTCGGPVRTTNCRAKTSLTVTKGRCNNKNSCSLQALNSVFGDPCWGTKKYLRVTFTCTRVPTYKSLGCFKDTGSRAVPQADGHHPEVRDNYHARRDAINKCRNVAARLGYKVFAVQNGGWCATGKSAHMTYNKYGPSTACGRDGEGGPWANNVYWLGDDCECVM